MKTVVFIAASLFIAAITVAQEPMEEIRVTAPTFKVGFYESIDDLLVNGVEYPAESRNAGLQGTAVIDFTVSVDGKVSDFQVINSISPEIDDEIIRVLQMTNGKWNPGTTNGNPAEMEKEVAVSFKLNPQVDFVAKAKNYLEKANELLFIKNNPSKAIKYYNMGVNFLPYEEVLLAMRGFCNLEMGNEEQARNDWERMAAISATSLITELALESEVFEGYKEFLLAMSNTD